MIAKTGPLVFLDTESTGLDRFRDEVWEVAAFRVEPDSDVIEACAFFVEHDLSLVEGLPDKYRADHDARYNPKTAISRVEAAHQMEVTFRGRAHMVGANPAFDSAMMQRWFPDGTEPWHYHLIDVEAMTLGYAAKAGLPVPVPWYSHDLSVMVGVQPPENAHQATADAFWVKRWFEALIEGVA